LRTETERPLLHTVRGVGYILQRDYEGAAE
jgi:hypothetical protein